MSNDVASNYENRSADVLVSPQNSQDMQSFTEAPATFTQSEIAWDGYFESVGVLMLLLVLLWLCFWAARRYGLFHMMPRAANIHRESLRLEGQLSIGPRKGIMVVRCLEKRLVLGVTDQNITLLTELAVDDEEKSANSISPPPPAPDSKLVQTFNTLLQKK